MSLYDSSGHEAVHALIEEFTVAARGLGPAVAFDASLARITATALEAVGGCDAASISLLTREGPVTYGPTDPLADAGDRIQYQENEGPCLDAALSERSVYTRDLAVDPRWPRSAARMSGELGVASMFSCRMALDSAPHGTLGGMNLYATSRDAFSEHDRMLAVLLSSLGAVVVAAAREREHLRAAVASRQVIGEAIGLLRAQSNLTSNQAFEMLAKASQRTNVKLRDLAQRISDGSRTGRDLM